MARYNGRAEVDDGEQQSLLPHHHANSAKPSASESNNATATWVTFLNKNIDTNRADLPLIASFFISGMIDAGAYNAYECFTSMQTGNTVFAALGVSDLPVSAPRIAWTKSLASILSFLLGSVLLTALHRRLGATKRWVLCISFLLQALMIAVSAVLVKLGHSSGSPVGGGGSMIIISDTVSSGGIAIPRDPGFPWTDLLPIAFLSFQAAGKVVASRMTSQTGLPVVVLTTLYNDLISDPALFTAGLSGNIPRNRKVGGLIMYFGGATVGGVAASSQLGFSGGLGIGCAIQVGIAIAWSVWFEEIKSDSDEQ